MTVNSYITIFLYIYLEVLKEFTLETEVIDVGICTQYNANYVLVFPISYDQWL